MRESESWALIGNRVVALDKRGVLGNNQTTSESRETKSMAHYLPDPKHLPVTWVFFLHHFPVSLLLSGAWCRSRHFSLTNINKLLLALATSLRVKLMSHHIARAFEQVQHNETQATRGLDDDSNDSTSRRPLN